MTNLFLLKYCVNVSGKKPWPSSVTVYRSYVSDQILLPELASSVSLQAYLQMNKLNYSVVDKRNAEFMSPIGEIYHTAVL